MRLTLLLSVLIAAAVLLAMPAAAKNGVRAKLDDPVRLGSAPGEIITVAWQLEDRKGRPFGASGIYLRVSRCGQRPRAIPATERSFGAYAASVKMPRRGIRRLLVGLRGWRIIGDRKERADMFFEFDPSLARHCT